MVHRFIKVVDGLFRGSAPTPKDVIALYKHFGIRKIISLDMNAGKAIDKICHLLNIKHITIPIDGVKLKPLIELLNYDLYDLLINDGPTYVHCIHGKDRTGMVIGMFQCKYLHMPCEEVIKNAEELGFGYKLDTNIKKLYKALICSVCDKNCCKKDKEDSNDVDIADNARQHGDFMDSVMDAATIQSFAPFMDTGRQYPYSQVYNYWNDQYPTRNNHDLKPQFDMDEKEDQVPAVGIFDSPARSVGPVDNGGGFVSI